MSNAMLAAHIARAIFKCGDERGDCVQRIQFMGGKWPERETKLGGLCEVALAGVIQTALENFASNRLPEHATRNK